jgi:hypothetical protein
VSMNPADHLSSTLGHRDQAANIALAKTIARTADTDAIEKLVALLKTGTKPLKHDAIKTLYEISTQRPDLLAPHVDHVFPLLASKDNRMIWGSLTLLDSLVHTIPNKLAENLNAILDATDRSSVVAKDKCMHLLSQLNSYQRFGPIVEPVMLDRLRHAAVNQFPMYAEFAASSVSEASKADLIAIIQQRKNTISYPAKQARLEKLLQKISKT